MGITCWALSLLALPMLQSAKILTVCLIGGSHYLLLDEISHNLHLQGHEVRMILQLGNPVITGFSYAGRADSYQTSTWSLGEKYIKEYNDFFLEQQKQFLLGRESFTSFLKFMGHLSYQCDKLLGDETIMTFLQKERYDITILDAFNPCSFILASKLGVRYIAFYPGGLNGPLSIALPSPLSYIPVFSSRLSDHMNFLDRARNLFYAFFAPVGQKLVWSAFMEVAEHHLDSGSPPGGLEELHQGAELWAFNTDFSLEFPQPLLPCTVLVGGLLNKHAKPTEQVCPFGADVQIHQTVSVTISLPFTSEFLLIPKHNHLFLVLCYSTLPAYFLHCLYPNCIDQDLQLWISGFGEAGVIVVSLGSMVSSISVAPLLIELVAGFSKIPQGVIWRYDPKRWPSHLLRPPNIRLADWLPLNDLLGHKKTRLFITHGGQNSLLQAVYHAVPVLAIPLFGDQFDNVVRAETKGLGLSIKPSHVTRELLNSTIQTLLQDSRFKSAALYLSRIHKSHPIAPSLRLVHWVEHILRSGGGSHLKLASLSQTWYQRCLLDLGLLFSMGLVLPVVLCWTFCRNSRSREPCKKNQ
ncbi:UDP-glucuronosyltransferase 3A1-like isoform X1 [Antennarius striatus]|uniref:UDP-glucuronosyltransferase 3A1-like isoform X1 n=1 Tax=Antennarius striatus TaxID=241820 RepID=UPI0035B3683D